jgi:site-specific recombinase XerD
LSDSSVLYRRNGTPKSESTCRSLCSTVRGFVAWAAAVGLLADEVAPEGPAYAPEAAVRACALTPADIQAIRTVVDGSPTAAHGGRDRLLIECLLTTGARVRELIRLTMNDVDLVRGHISLGCGNVTGRSLPLVAPVQARFLTYLRWRATHVDGDTAVCFLSNAGRHLSAGRVTSWITQWLQQAGLANGLTPLSFRATLASWLFERTHDLLLVRRLLGFSSLKVTMAYITHPSEPVETLFAELAEP